MFLKHLFKDKHPRLIGIDITSSTVKLLELSRSGGHYTVETFAITPLPPEAIVENRIHNPEAISAAVAHVVELGKPSTHQVALAVSSALVITKVLALDNKLSGEDLENQVLLQEAPRILPFPMEEVSLDFEILGPNKAQPLLNEVLIAASRTENVMERVKAIESVGLTVKVVDVESYTMERTCQLICHQLPNEGVNKTIAVVDIGSLLTKITVLHNRETIFYREEAFGGHQLTEAIQQRYNLSNAQAGLAKKRNDLGEDYVTNVLDPFRQSLVPLIRRSLQFFFTAHHNIPQIDHILLAGGGALTSGLVQVLDEQIGIPVSIANPFAEMNFNPRVNATSLNANASTLMIACGLALRSF